MNYSFSWYNVIKCLSYSFCPIIPFETKCTEKYEYKHVLHILQDKEQFIKYFFPRCSTKCLKSKVFPLFCLPSVLTLRNDIDSVWVYISYRGVLTSCCVNNFCISQTSASFIWNYKN